ncbi:hypothetical protein FMUND_14644 [Fusarium mundagurra]|uniref:Uncharacterized protein n=1 Tax=Fusarium mundagurra TaxID=1567541 RepID=A0A8H5XTA6_9HYPO|nr:hypothetical protein FMUND_14644 [Fusarium mundagurra]
MPTGNHLDLSSMPEDHLKALLKADVWRQFPMLDREQCEAFVELQNSNAKQEHESQVTEMSGSESDASTSKCKGVDKPSDACDCGQQHGFQLQKEMAHIWIKIIAQCTHYYTSVRKKSPGERISLLETIIENGKMCIPELERLAKELDDEMPSCNYEDWGMAMMRICGVKLTIRDLKERLDKVKQELERLKTKYKISI